MAVAPVAVRGILVDISNGDAMNGAIHKLLRGKNLGVWPPEREK